MIVTPADAKNIDKVLKLIGKTPEEVVLEGVDFASIKDERRASSRDRGGARERGGRGERGSRDRARPIAPHGEVAAMEPLVAAPADGESENEAPKRRSRARAEAPAKAEPKAAPQAAPKVAPDAAEPARRDRSRREPREDSVVGFGNDIPAFLLRAPPRATTTE